MGGGMGRLNDALKYCLRLQVKRHFRAAASA